MLQAFSDLSYLWASIEYKYNGVHLTDISVKHDGHFDSQYEKDKSDRSANYPECSGRLQSEWKAFILSPNFASVAAVVLFTAMCLRARCGSWGIILFWLGISAWNWTRAESLRGTIVYYTALPAAQLLEQWINKISSREQSYLCFSSSISRSSL